MFKKSSILLIVLLSILVLVAGCGGTNAAPISGDQKQAPQPVATTAQNQIAPSSSAPAQVVASLNKEKGITIHLTVKKEALDKIGGSEKDINKFLSCEITKRFNESSSFPAPEIKITITNIMKETMKMDASAAIPGRFYLSLCSKDKNGGLLGSLKYPGFTTIEPKETKSQLVDLFSSPEVTDCYLELGYTGEPEMKFTLVQNQETGQVGDQLTFSFKTEYKEYIGVVITVTITNSSDKPFKSANGGSLYLRLQYKDAKGNLSLPDVKPFLGSGGKMDPGKIKTFEFILRNFQETESCDYSITD